MNNNFRKFFKKRPVIKHFYWDLRNIANNLLYNDQSFYRKEYKHTHGEYPNLHNPQTFSEKLLWSMLNHRNILYVQCVDKYSVREYVRKKIGANYLIKCIDIYTNIEEIKFDLLPDSFVLKATHSSGWNIICRDKTQLNKSKTMSELKYWLSNNYYKIYREWPYKYVTPRIICEEYIGDEVGNPPLDYKFFCFNGEPKLIQLDIDRFKSHKRNIYDINWNQLINYEIAHKQDFEKTYEKPTKLKEMLDIARKLSEGIEHVRIDLYYVNNNIYFGEMTFFHGAGMHEYFVPKSFHLEVGTWFELPKRNIKEWDGK